MFIFGEFKKIDNADDLKEVFIQSKKVSQQLSETSIEHIISELDKVGKHWHSESKWYQKALTILPHELSFSSSMIKATLDLIPELLSREVLYQRLNAELGDVQLLDQLGCRPNFNGQVRYFPIGTLLHVSAGNVFLGCIDSLLMGLLTKNINVLKLSSKNQTFPQLFAESVLEISNELASKFAIVYWKGGDSSYESVAKNNANAIIAWGGEDMLSSYKENLPIDVKLIDYGPKISIQVLTKKYFLENDLQQIADKIVEDICMWDQSACAASQNLFVEDSIDVKKLMDALDGAFKKYSIERGELSADEYVDILKEKFRAEYSFLETQIDYVEGKDYLIHFDSDKRLRPSPLNRTLVIKPFKKLDELAENLNNFNFYLQSCGLGVTLEEREKWIHKLANAGILRFCDLGKMLQSMTGAPHDGRYGLSELVNIVAYEHTQDMSDFLAKVCSEIPFYQQYQGKNLEEFPLMDGKILARHGLMAQQHLNEFNDKVHDNLPMTADQKQGYIFASGGTTGEPKYSLYSCEEFQQTCKLLGRSYIQAGLTFGDIVANLFVAGNMWSSFSAVQLALQSCPVLQLPIGGKVNIDDLKKYLITFKVNVVFGLPGMLLDLAQELAESGAQIHIEKVFYAGEMLKDSTKNALKKLWGVKKFISAGYASVDVGPIGYQVPDANQGVHYLFKHIHPEVIDDELVVTSTLRASMPIIRYKTGDRVKLLGKDHIGYKIQLIGRSDSLVQIWGCRFGLDDISSSLQKSYLFNKINKKIDNDLNNDSNIDFQVILEHQKSKGEVLKILLSTPLAIIDLQHFCNVFYQNCVDVQQTVTTEFLLNHIEISVTSFQRNKRTGKASKLLDLR